MPFVTSTLDCLEELAFLRAYRCEEAQGYYFSRSVPPQQFAMLLRSGITESSVVA
jgi:EAL domain-containing protein (putative c-di-GMP-specific phosphodiesterase class I)